MRKTSFGERLGTSKPSGGIHSKADCRRNGQKQRANRNGRKVLE